MALTDEDVREILRIIDESDLTELRLETEDFSLHVVKGERGADAPAPSRRPRKAPADDAPKPSEPATADGLCHDHRPDAGDVLPRGGPR